jgi:hypothetical protein
MREITATSIRLPVEGTEIPKIESINSVCIVAFAGRFRV